MNMWAFRIKDRSRGRGRDRLSLSHQDAEDEEYLHDSLETAEELDGVEYDKPQVTIVSW